MKSIQYFLGLIIFCITYTSTQAQNAQYPVVQNFGGIYEIPGSTNPDPDLEYNIVIDLKTLQQNKEEINPGLNNVARMMNLHGLGGVSSENLNVVVVVHGGATETILTGDGYRKKNGAEHPNLKLIQALIDAEAEIYVCGQSLISRGFEEKEVNHDVSIGLSMLTVVTEHMHKGYQLLVFD
ncbi:MAG: DsrE family protein [Balneolaceae bacterium]